MRKRSESKTRGKGRQLIVREIYFNEVGVGLDKVKFLYTRLALAQNEHSHIARLLHCLQLHGDLSRRCHYFSLLLYYKQ